MSVDEIMRICKKREELDFLFSITKIIAENDSIGERYSYCAEYTREMFDNNDEYLTFCGIPIYEEYLRQIKVI